MLSQLSKSWGVSETKIVIKIIITSVQSLHITIRNINIYLYSCHHIEIAKTSYIVPLK